MIYFSLRAMFLKIDFANDRAEWEELDLNRRFFRHVDEYR